MEARALFRRLSREARAAILARGPDGLEADALALRSLNPLLPHADGGLWHPTPYDDFLPNTEARFATLVGDNGSAKTSHGAVYAIKAMLGQVPRFAGLGRAIKVWMVAEDFPHSREKQQLEFWKWVPPDACDKSRFTKERGWVNRMCVLNNGSVVSLVQPLDGEVPLARVGEDAHDQLPLVLGPPCELPRHVGGGARGDPGQDPLDGGAPLRRQQAQLLLDEVLPREEVVPAVASSA